MGRLCLLPILCCVSTARADEPVPEAPTYHLQILAADGVAIAFASYQLYASTGASGGSKNDSSYAVPALVVFAAAAPTVHLFHNNYLGAGISLGLRVGLPLAGYYIAYASRCQGSYCDNGNADYIREYTFGTIGGIAAMIGDNAALAHEPSTWTPTVTPAAHGAGATFGIAGSWR